LTGVGRYTLNLARALSRQLDPGSVTLLLTRDSVDLDGLGCERVRAPLPTPHEGLRGLWEQTLVPIDVRRRGIDVYHSPSYSLPMSIACPAAVTVHDLAFLDPRFHKLRVRLYLQLLTRLALRRADHVIVVSKHTKNQVEARFPRVAGRVSVVYPGLDPIFASLPSAAAVREFRERLGLTKPYVLFVGAIEPRKNLPRLVRAFEMAVAEGDLPHDLVLCGPLGWRYGPTMRAAQVSRLSHRIKHVGYVPVEDLPLWYGGADLFAYPSLCEGFGFPPLEAMASGTPVVTSNSSSLPEVVGEAAITVQPTDVRDLAAAIQRVATDRDLAGELTERGQRRARRFTWEEAAAATVDIYRRLARQ
jgi:glycosyltransferase involved in cell wall biosynthesis